MSTGHIILLQIIRLLLQFPILPPKADAVLTPPIVMNECALVSPAGSHLDL